MNVFMKAFVVNKANSRLHAVVSWRGHIGLGRLSSSAAKYCYTISYSVAVRTDGRH